MKPYARRHAATRASRWRARGAPATSTACRDRPKCGTTAAPADPAARARWFPPASARTGAMQARSAEAADSTPRAPFPRPRAARSRRTPRRTRGVRATRRRRGTSAASCTRTRRSVGASAADRAAVGGRREWPRASAFPPDDDDGAERRVAAEDPGQRAPQRDLRSARTQVRSRIAVRARVQIEQTRRGLDVRVDAPPPDYVRPRIDEDAFRLPPANRQREIGPYPVHRRPRERKRAADVLPRAQRHDSALKRRKPRGDDRFVDHVKPPDPAARLHPAGRADRGAIDRAGGIAARCAPR